MNLRVPSLLFVILGLLPGCADAPDLSEADELLERIEGEYTEWDRAPGFPGREASTAPHGDEVEIFVNPTLQDAMDAGDTLSVWPDGSIIAKNGYESGSLKYLAAMEKQDGDWFWVERIHDEIKYSGAPSICTGCHSAGEDFVRAFPLP